MDYLVSLIFRRAEILIPYLTTRVCHLEEILKRGNNFTAFQCENFVMRRFSVTQIYRLKSLPCENLAWQKFHVAEIVET